MVAIAARDVSAELKALKEKVDEWRRRQGKRTRIPNELWDEAVKVAARAGLWATAKATRFHYPDLKERGMRAAAQDRPPASALMRIPDEPVAQGANGAARAGGAAFVELPMTAVDAGGRTVIELVGRQGDRMRVETAGGVDLVGLARALWRGGEA